MFGGTAFGRIRRHHVGELDDDGLGGLGGEGGEAQGKNQQ
jgi:hypothetical protein